MEKFKKMYNDFNYSYQKKLIPKQTVICPIPRPNGKQRSVKSISWSTASDVTASATLTENYNSIYAFWEPLKNDAQLSPAITAIKFSNPTTYNKEVFVWVTME